MKGRKRKSGRGMKEVITEVSHQSRSKGKESAKPSQNDAGGGGGGETGGNTAGDQLNPHQLIEQARASHALAWIQEAMAAKGVKQSELKSYTRGLPAMIQMNGFGQAMAFYYARSDKGAYKAVYKLVETWLCGPHKHQHTTGDPIYAAVIQQGEGQNQPPPSPLLTAITQQNQQRYRHAQAETQALLRWARKFAEALINKDAATDAQANQGEVAE